MGLHLAEIAARVTPGRHCALLVDQAGWHISERFSVPSNITIVLRRHRRSLLLRVKSIGLRNWATGSAQ
jgi:hypothetical protein